MKNKSDSNQITREYFDSLLLETRYMDSDLPSTEVTIWGKTFSTPIMTAALSHLEQVRKNGMAEMAEGAKKAGVLYWCGMGEDEELEAITATGAQVVKIIKPHEDNAEVFRKIRHSVECGVVAVGMDIDHAFSGNGTYDNVLGLPMKPKTTEEIRSFVEASPVPFVVKGVLSVHDAQKCLEAGVQGIVVSHHHGIMQYAVPPLLVLEEIVNYIDGRIPVFVDCGIESGMDAFKALALGADAVSVGRELMKPLKDGSDAVCKRIMEMTGELASVMARTGNKNVQSIDSSVIWKRAF